MQSASQCPFGSGFDFTDPDIMLGGRPVEQYARLRRTAPVWWNAQPPERSGGFRDGGYWVVSKHEHVREMSLRSDQWSTWDNTVNIRFTDDASPEQIEMSKALLVNHDAPQHTRLRKLISRMFTPRAIEALRPRLEAEARRIVTRAAEKGTGEFVADIAMQLPLLSIADLLGVPEEDRRDLFGWTNTMTRFDDPDVSTQRAAEATAEILGYSYQLAEKRKSCPTGDIISTLVQADVDGQSLTEIEFGFFVLMLAVAGNETTRNATTLGLMALLQNPDQWEIFKRQRPATAINEIVRWSTPVNVFQRTARCDLELGGVRIAKGQRAGMFYGSANFDEDVFDQPFSFNILRDPNPHVGFGGHGAHYCVGANLARLGLELVFNAIADVVPDITMTGPPVRQPSAWLHSILELPVDYGTAPG
ncbi:cytochrome P450 [Mycolicibacterium stellerae]|uniref:cytochrome P450 n=1 Tax=Mycolicibacterium stellerae TaxID=2358193 RepID=UPI000F0B272C|nr:cytochrome P450 [Mycolicibacterium stellerae]